MRLRTDRTMTLLYGPQLNQLGERLHYDTYDPFGDLNQAGLHSILNMRLEIQNGCTNSTKPIPERRPDKHRVDAPEVLDKNPEPTEASPGNGKDNPIQTPVTTDTPDKTSNDPIEVQDDPRSETVPTLPTDIKFITLELT